MIEFALAFFGRQSKRRSPYPFASVVSDGTVSPANVTVSLIHLRCWAESEVLVLSPCGVRCCGNWSSLVEHSSGVENFVTWLEAGSVGSPHPLASDVRPEGFRFGFVWKFSKRKGFQSLPFAPTHASGSPAQQYSHSGTHSPVPSGPTPDRLRWKGLIAGKSC